MVNKIIIIEDNFCSYFVTKQLLETQFHLVTETIDADDANDALAKAHALVPHKLLMRQGVSAAELMEQFKKAKANRRNTKVILLVVSQLSDRDLGLLHRALNQKHHEVQCPQISQAA